MRKMKIFFQTHLILILILISNLVRYIMIPILYSNYNLIIIYYLDKLLKQFKVLFQEFPCYRDEAEWNGIGVSLYKRAQILIGDLVV